MTRKPRIMIIDPGASWSTADVCHGLITGLQATGAVDLILYRLAARIDYAHRFLNGAWRQKHRAAKRALAHAHAAMPEAVPAATEAVISLEANRISRQEILYEASIGAVAVALQQMPDVVLIVSAMFFHPNVIVQLKRAGFRVVVLFTESPYDLEKELAVLKLRVTDEHSPLAIDGCWTNERSVVPAFAAVQPASGYLPHAWHPDRHQAGPQPGDDQVPAHDVVFVGSAFRERIAFLSAIDWTGIDFGLYGEWSGLPARSPLRRHLKGGMVDNARTAALYRRAKIGLNLYRTSIGWGPKAPSIAYAESLNPRAYELAACGVFHLSDYRREVADVFGPLVPTFASPAEAATLIRTWLADAAGREAIARHLPACVAESSWGNRAATVIGDLVTLLGWSTRPSAA